MQIEIRSDGVLISGYVNAVARDSKEIGTNSGIFVECIEPGTFADALVRAEDVKMYLNHNPDRELASVSENTLTLNEDKIGLFATAWVVDPEVVDLARSGRLKGWSFGFQVLEDEIEQRVDTDIPRRHIKKINLEEVSIIAGSFTPIYTGTSVEVRGESRTVVEYRSMVDDIFTKNLFFNDTAMRKLKEYRAVVNKLKEKGKKIHA